MEAPTMMPVRRVAPDTDALTCYLPVPGMGVLPINAFVIRAAEPILVDAGVLAMGEQYFDALCSALDPEEIRWIWLTHTDLDHVGCLDRVLEVAPKARLITTFIGMAKLSLGRPVAPERLYLLNPGQILDVGDRSLLAFKPPTFDAPETTGLFDSKTRTLFSSDCFGALLQRPFETAAQISAKELRDGLVTWATVDAPWLGTAHQGAFGRALETVTVLAPSVVLSSHLPPATDMTATLLELLDLARSAPPFVGPDQGALEGLLGAA